MTESKTEKRATEESCPYYDFVFGALSYVILLIIDPLIATVIGAPMCVVAFVLRNRWWPSRPIAGGVVMMVLIPWCSLGIACVFAFASFGLFGGTVLAFASLAFAEFLNRRAGRSFIRRFTITAGVFFFILTFVFSALLLETGLASYPTEELVKKISQAPEAPEWKRESKEEAVLAITKVIDRVIDNNEQAQVLYESLASKSSQLMGESSPYGVYVTLYDKDGYRSRGAAIYGKDSLDKVVQAAFKAIAKRPYKPRKRKKAPGPWRALSKDTRIQVDVAGPSQRITTRPIFYLFAELVRGADRSLKVLKPLDELLNLSFQVESGIDGLIVTNNATDTNAIALPSDPVTCGWFTPRVRSAPGKMKVMLRRTWRREFDEKLNLKEDDYKVRKFRTHSFGVMGAGEPVLDWYRGNVLAEKNLTRDKLVDRIILTADWLSRQVKPSGEFAYEKFPPYRNETDSYSLPRHAGSVYGLFAIHEASLSRPELKKAGVRALDAGLKALNYIGENLDTPTYEGQPGHLCFLDKKKVAASGSTALAAVSIAKLVEPSQITDPALRSRVEAIPKEKWMLGMGQCMLQMIDGEGAVFKTYRESRTLEAVVKEPMYFPGEVMLALLRIYKKTDDKRFLEGAKKIGARQSRIYKWATTLDLPLPGDHWIMQALSELSITTGEPKWAELSVLMGHGYLREQHPPQEFLYPDYLGGYRRVADLPRTTRAASRGEALGGAMYAARFLKISSEEFENGLIEGARHLLEQQFIKENSYFIPAGHDVIGGIRMGLVDNHLRIDNNQHALVALIRALEAMDFQSGAVTE